MPEQVAASFIESYGPFGLLAIIGFVIAFVVWKHYRMSQERLLDYLPKVTLALDSNTKALEKSQDTLTRIATLLERQNPR